MNSSVVNLQLNAPSVNLHRAARDGREQVVSEWIAYCSYKQIPPSFFNNLDKYGYNPLLYAAKFNRYDILVALIKAGADTNVLGGEENFTPLHFCARYLPRVAEHNLSETEEQTRKVDKWSSSWKAISYLTSLTGDNKVNVNAKNRYGVSPLHLACKRGNLKAVKILLRSSEIDVCIVDKNGDTPLHEACYSGHKEVVMTLLEWLELDNLKELPSRVNTQNNDGETPIHLACEENHVEIVKMILMRIREYSERFKLCETTNNSGSTALHLACQSGNSEMVHLLILQGADVDAVKNEKITPMHIAAKYGHVDVGETLLEGDSEVNMSDESGLTPLHYAAEYNQVDMIYFLVSKNGDVTATDKFTFTPLLKAAYKGHVEAFEALLDVKASIDDVDEDDKTVVHLAAEQNHPNLLAKLLQDDQIYDLVQSTDTWCRTPFHLAALNGHIECVQLMLFSKNYIPIFAKDESNRTALHLATRNGHHNVVKIMLEKEEEGIQMEDENGNTPLHIAATNGYYLTAKELLKKNAECDARNGKLWTPIDEASAKGHAKVVEMLIEAHSEVDPTDKEGTTPLHRAACNGHLKVVKILLDNSANANALDVDGNSPLDLAINCDHEDIAMAIIQSTQWKAVLRHTCEIQGLETTPLRRLIVRMPAVATEVFNQCSKIEEKNKDPNQPGKKDFLVHFDYEFLEDFQDKPDLFSRISDLFKKSSLEVDDIVKKEHVTTDSVRYNRIKTMKDKVTREFNLETFTTAWGPMGFSKNNHPLTFMVENDRADLLKHPLVISLLNLKWLIFGSSAYAVNLSSYVIFVTLFTAFALLLPNPQTATCRLVENNTFGQMRSLSIFFINNSFGCSQSEDQVTVLRIVAVVVIIFAAIRLIFEIFQILNVGYLYLRDWINFIECTLFSLTIAFSTVLTRTCLCPTSWQWQVGCIAIFLAWIEFIIFFRKFQFAGIYVLMFVDIFKTFWKLIFLTVSLLVAFALAFFMALHDFSASFERSSFSQPQRSLLKTMTMTTGEFEYDSIFRQFPGGTEAGQVVNELQFLPVSVILWIAFIILMPILLTNLLVGLAVDDIKGIQNAAELKRLGLQVELALSVEEVMPTRLRRLFIRKTHTIHANRNLNIVELIKYRFFGKEEDRFDCPENMYWSLRPPLEPIEHVQKQTSSLVSDMKEIKETIQDMKQMNETVQSIKEAMWDMKLINEELMKQKEEMQALLFRISKAFTRQSGAPVDDSVANM